MSIPQDPEMDWRVWTSLDNIHKKKLSLRKTHLFLKEKYVRDIIWDQTFALDLLESIMKPTDPVKEELRWILSNTFHSRPTITNIKVCTFQMSEKLRNFRRKRPAGAKYVFFDPFPSHSHLITAPQTRQK